MKSRQSAKQEISTYRVDGFLVIDYWFIDWLRSGMTQQLQRKVIFLLRISAILYVSASYAE